MLKVTVLLSILALSLCIIDPETYEEIKKRASFEVLSFEEVQEIFKDKTFHSDKPDFISEENLKSALEKSETESPHLSFLANTVIPLNFDPRVERNYCDWTAKDQKHCGSCYAFSTTSCLQLRFCMMSQGKLKPNLSPQDHVSCDRSAGGCKGGGLDTSWYHLENFGVVEESCLPYVSGEGHVPPCTYMCQNPAQKFIRWRARPRSLIIINDRTRIKYELMTKGPMLVGFQVYEDLIPYKGGIYVHVWGKATEKHAVAVVGWGFDPQTRLEYWLIRNSWGTKWGENGYLKMPFGYLDIDRFAMASDPLM